MTTLNKITAALFALSTLTCAGSYANDAEDGIAIGGTVRANYQYKEYSDQSKDKAGDLKFDVLAIKFNGSLNGIGLASEYRFYEGYHMLLNAYAYGEIGEQIQATIGLTKVPFGNPGYISNSFWFGLPYYLGFEDDHDMGATLQFSHGNWTTDLGAFKNAEYSPSNSQRYSTDIYEGTINGTQYNNEETNQLNLRETYLIEHASGQSIVGASVEWGQIYNTETGDNGDRYALALHLDSSINDWNLQLQAIQYEYDAADASNPNKIALSAFDWQYEVASKGQIYSLNIAKTIPTSFGSIKVYNDFGMMTPDVDDSSYDDSLMNVLGMGISAGPTYTYVDLISGKNMYAAGINDHIGLPQADDGWDHRININLGYYF
ncbi:hypothetical protein [Ferrimonas sp. YFM]|uniref:hypothetical protein n=1 Tax=Ferrimonas sp. YFM TaxID=3028878 RepID=UPI002572F6FC|nr:hypothetical protein [Ferrimonas sp. YFM]BDY06088.1 outer membrane beta barrel protein [Ferrimonas sp. YFM]